MSVVEDLSRRRGGREARRAMRARPVPMEEAAVHPGQHGGQYKPLTQRDMERIHAAALHLLETVGFGNSIPSCVEAMEAKGAKLGSDGRLRIPRGLVEDTIAMAARRFVLPARDEKHDLEPWDNKVYFGTAGAAVHIVDQIELGYRAVLQGRDFKAASQTLANALRLAHENPGVFLGDANQRENGSPSQSRPKRVAQRLLHQSEACQIRSE